MGPLSIGTYATSEFRPSVEFDIADQGWIANRDGPDMFGLIRDSAPRGSVQFLRVQEVIPSPCIAGGDGASTGPVLADPLAALEGLEHLTLQDPKPTTMGDYQGNQVDVTVSERHSLPVAVWSARTSRSSAPAMRSGVRRRASGSGS